MLPDDWESRDYDKVRDLDDGLKSEAVALQTLADAAVADAVAGQVLPNVEKFSVVVRVVVMPDPNVITCRFVCPSPHPQVQDASAALVTAVGEACTNLNNFIIRTRDMPRLSFFAAIPLNLPNLRSLTIDQGNGQCRGSSNFELCAARCLSSLHGLESLRLPVADLTLEVAQLLAVMEGLKVLEVAQSFLPSRIKCSDMQQCSLQALELDCLDWNLGSASGPDAVAAVAAVVTGSGFIVDALPGCKQGI